MKNIKNTKLFLFDLDGTIYHDQILIKGVKQTLSKLREKGCKIVYLTNNSSCPKSEYETKLKGLGVFEPSDLVYSSLDCAVDFFLKYRQNKKVYAVATKKVSRYLAEQGLNIVSQENSQTAEVLLLTFDRELDYEKIKTANELLVGGKEYIATHPDLVCPTSTVAVPDVGSFIQMLKASSGREPDIILGKPYKYVAEFLLDKLGVSAEQTTMVGDRLSTDIQFGVNVQANSVLVLTGEATALDHKRSKTKADYVLDSVSDLLKFWE